MAKDKYMHRVLARLSIHFGSCIFVAALAPWTARADGTTELPAGIVVFAGAGQIATETETIALSRDAVRITSILQNTEGTARSVLMAFGLPDIDMATLAGAPVSVPSYDSSNPTNYVGFWARVDGADVPLKVEQRGLALGMVDATQILQRNAIPLYPLTADVSDTLTALPQVVRADLVAGGLIHLSDGQFEPLWTLKTHFFWTQPLPPSGQAIRLTYGYRPISGQSSWTPETSDGLAERFCIPSAKVENLNSRAASGRVVTVNWIHFQPGTAGQTRGPAVDYSLAIERPSEQTLIATCKTGLTATPGGTLEFKAPNHINEDDVLVAFID
jgi:Domain of unknown function (DUF4424)